MKKFNLLLLTFIFSGLFITANAQSQRMVVVEEGTQASCGPCASNNPALQAILANNPGNHVFVAYQVSWPGDDAMNQDNPGEVQTRIQDFYGVEGVPNVVVQGDSGPQSVSFVTQSLIDNIYADTSEFDMTLSAEIINGKLVIDGLATAYKEVSGNLKMRLIITEALIETEDLAFNGTNGETEFHHVFKKFIYGHGGITLADSWAVGDTYTISEEFDLSTLNIYNYEELEIVAIIQNDDNKFIHQAAKAAEFEITVDATNNVAASAIDGLPSSFCSGTQEAVVEFNLVNTGNDILTSATVSYNVNGGTDATFDWTGSLTTFQKEKVNLPAISFDSESTNVVNITVSNPNGEIDEDDSDNSAISQEVFLSPTSTDSITIELKTDDYGDETYWEVRDGNGDIISWGGNPNVGIDNIGTGTFPPPADAASYASNTKYIISVPIPEDGCYTFHITDYYGDGLAATPVGYYKVFDDLGEEIIISDGTIFDEVIDFYDGKFLTDVKDFITVNSVELYPNPVQNVATLSFEITNTVKATISISNAIGQKVYSKDLGKLISGAHNQEIDMSNFNNGIYLVQINLNDEVITKKITVTK